MLQATWDIFADKATGNPFDALLSRQAISETGYFDPAVVGSMTQSTQDASASFTTRHNLVAIAAVQLWHHMFIKDLGAPIERVPSRY